MSIWRLAVTALTVRTNCRPFRTVPVAVHSTVERDPGARGARPAAGGQDRADLPELVAGVAVVGVALGDQDEALGAVDRRGQRDGRGRREAGAAEGRAAALHGDAGRELGDVVAD